MKKTEQKNKRLPTGKLKESILLRSVLRQLPTRGEALLAGPSIGEDCAILKMENELALTANSFFFTEKGRAGDAVYHAINDLLAAGAEPMGILLTLLLPENFWESQLKALTSQISDVCQKEGLTVMGGHTQVLPLVSSPILSITGIGSKKQTPETDISSYTDLDIVVTKWIGLEGTLILLSEKEDELNTRFSPSFLNAIRKWEPLLSIRPEADLAKRFKAVKQHNVSEGGIFGALWEMAQAAGTGLEVDLKKIPIRQETIELCEQYEWNPYLLNGNGSLLLYLKHGQEYVEAARQNGISAAVIGRTTAGNDRIIYNEEEKRFLEPAGQDELYQLLEPQLL